MSHALDVATDIAAQDSALGARLYAALKAPFAVAVLNDERKIHAVTIAGGADWCAEAWQPLEPYVPWRRDLLAGRAQCYRNTGNARASEAQAELETFMRDEPAPFAHALPTPRAIVVSQN
jgi:hypothetical protein